MSVLMSISDCGTPGSWRISDNPQSFSFSSQSFPQVPCSFHLSLKVTHVCSNNTAKIHKINLMYKCLGNYFQAKERFNTCQSCHHIQRSGDAVAEAGEHLFLCVRYRRVAGNVLLDGLQLSFALFPARGCEMHAKPFVQFRALFCGTTREQDVRPVGHRLALGGAAVLALAPHHQHEVVEVPAVMAVLAEEQPAEGIEVAACSRSPSIYGLLPLAVPLASLYSAERLLSTGSARIRGAGHEPLIHTRRAHININQLTMKGKDVKRRIAAQGYTVADAAEKIGTSQPNLSQLLSTQNVRTGLIERVTSTLGLPVSYFLPPRHRQCRCLWRPFCGICPWRRVGVRRQRRRAQGAREVA